MVSMKRLGREQRAAVIHALVEGNSIRSTCRMTGVAKATVMKLLAQAGEACLDYQDRTLRNLPCQRVQCDEIWSFCYSKQKNVSPEHAGEFGYGDVWTWTAIDADTKLVPCWLVGDRTGAAATEFISDLASRIANRVQLTTDGHKPYLEAVEGAFGGEIDYAMLIKIYGEDPESERRYSPAKCIGTEARPIVGSPDPLHVNTSYVERQNLTMRMSMRRFTRLTNAFSKKVQNHGHALALYFLYYNFGRPHQSLKNPYPRTPAMAAGVADHIWTISEIVALVEALDAPAKKRGPYKPRQPKLSD